MLWDMIDMTVWSRSGGMAAIVSCHQDICNHHGGEGSVHVRSAQPCKSIFMKEKYFWMRLVWSPRATRLFYHTLCNSKKNTKVQHYWPLVVSHQKDPRNAGNVIMASCICFKHIYLTTIGKQFTTIRPSCWTSCISHRAVASHGNFVIWWIILKFWHIYIYIYMIHPFIQWNRCHGETYFVLGMCYNL